MSEDEFDVVIIGAGVAGLTSAALLSRSGIKVCVLERHRLIGGYLQGFERKGFIFDTAIHWLNQCNEYGTVSRVFNYLGTDYPRPKAMKNIFKHVGGDYPFLLTNNPDILKQQLIKDFPHEKRGIEKFFEAAKTVAEVSKKFPEFFLTNELKSGIGKALFKINQLRIIFPLIQYALYGGEKGVEKGLRKFFNDEKLLGLFRSEPDLLSCLFPIAWAYNNDYQNPPEGGSQVIPEWIHKQIADNGSQVILSADVYKIHIENGVFTGVSYRKRLKEYAVNAKYLIAACDIDSLYKKLLPAGSIPQGVIQKLDKAELYSSSVTISVALTCPAETLGFGDEMVHLFNEDTSRMEHSSGDPHKSFISVLAPTVRDKTLAPEGMGTLNIFVPAWMDYQGNWGSMMNEKGEYERNETYKEIKEAFATVIFERVEKHLCPNLRKHILFYEVATPITYYRYTHNKNGTMMGTRPGRKNMELKVATYTTPIQNIFIGGHWAELGGGVPIAVKAAFNASLLVLKNENKEEFNKMVRYIKQTPKLT